MQEGRRAEGQIRPKRGACADVIAIVNTLNKCKECEMQVCNGCGKEYLRVRWHGSLSGTRCPHCTPFYLRSKASIDSLVCL